MNVVIIDDELDARKSIRFYIEKHLPTCTIVGEADGVATGIQCIEDLNPDVVFLDISLGDGTGFDILAKLPNRTFQVVFVTGFDEYAIKAFKYSAVDYILKPIDSDDFILLEQKLIKQKQSSDIKKRLKLLESQIHNAVLAKIALPQDDGTLFVALTDIVRLEADGNYTRIQIIGKKDIFVTRLLKDFEEILDSGSFLRIHKSHIVNINHVDRYNKVDEAVVLNGGKEVPLARRRKKELLERLMG